MYMKSAFSVYGLHIRLHEMLSNPSNRRFSTETGIAVMHDARDRDIFDIFTQFLDAMSERCFGVAEDLFNAAL